MPRARKVQAELPPTPLPAPDADGVIRIPLSPALEDAQRRALRADQIRSFPRIAGTQHAYRRPGNRGDG